MFVLWPKFREIYLILFQLLYISDPQVVITSTIQDVHLMVDQNQTVLFEIENSSLLNDSYSLDTIAIPNNVVKLLPSSVQIHKGDKNFTINIRATDAGKTTVTLNKSTNFLKYEHQTQKQLLFKQTYLFYPSWHYF